MAGQHVVVGKIEGSALLAGLVQRRLQVRFSFKCILFVFLTGIIEVFLHDPDLEFRVRLFAAIDNTDPASAADLHKIVSLGLHGRKVRDAGHVFTGFADGTDAARNNKISNSRSDDRYILGRRIGLPERHCAARKDQIVLVLQEMIDDQVAVLLCAVRHFQVEDHFVPHHVGKLRNEARRRLVKRLVSRLLDDPHIILVFIVHCGRVFGRFARLGRYRCRRVFRGLVAFLLIFSSTSCRNKHHAAQHYCCKSSVHK